MSERSGSHESLRRETGAAAARAHAADSELRRRVEQPPQPGDVFVIRETAELPLEWVVLEPDADDPRRLLAVPADTNPQVGSADVALAEDARRAPLTLRCGFPVWLAATALDPELRSGRLASGDLARARRKRRELEQGDPTGSAMERRVDGDLTYREWLEEVLEPARAACSDEPVAEQGSGGDSPEIVAFPPRRRWTTISNPYSVAASVLLLISVGLGREVVRSVDKRRLDQEAHRRDVEDLERQHERLEVDHRERVAEAEQHMRLETEKVAAAQKQLEELRASARPRPVGNLPFIVLTSLPVRGGAESRTLELPPGADLGAVILQVSDPEPYPSYRLDVLEPGSGRRVWEISGLTLTGAAELSLGLPRGQLPAGEYLLRLYGLRDGRAEEVDEYQLRIDGGLR